MTAASQSSPPLQMDSSSAGSSTSQARLLQVVQIAALHGGHGIPRLWLATTRRSASSRDKGFT